MLYRTLLFTDLPSIHGFNDSQDRKQGKTTKYHEIKPRIPVLAFAGCNTLACITYTFNVSIFVQFFETDI